MFQRDQLRIFNRWKMESLNLIFNFPVGDLKFITPSPVSYPLPWSKVSPLPPKVSEDYGREYYPDIEAKADRNDTRNDHSNELKQRNESDFQGLIEALSDPSSGLPIYEVDEEINSKIHLTRDFYLRLPVHAVVNSANEALLGGGGLDALIHYYAGESLKEEASSLPTVPGYETYYYPVKCLTGDAVLTTAHNLPMRYIVHTVCPYLDESNQPQPELLLRSYRNVLRFLDGDHIASLAVGPLATGYYGYPMVEAAILSLRVFREYLQSIKKNQRDLFNRIDKIFIWITNDLQYDIHQRLWQQIFPTLP